MEQPIRVLYYSLALLPDSKICLWHQHQSHTGQKMPNWVRANYYHKTFTSQVTCNIQSKWFISVKHSYANIIFNDIDNSSQLRSGSMSNGDLDKSHKDRRGWQCLKYGPNPASFCLFSFFSQIKYKYSTILTINDESEDGVLGIRNQGGRMVGTDDPTEPCRQVDNICAERVEDNSKGGKMRTKIK